MKTETEISEYLRILRLALIVKGRNAMPYQFRNLVDAQITTLEWVLGNRNLDDAIGGLAGRVKEYLEEVG